MAKISLMVEIPEHVHEGLQAFLDQRTGWDQDLTFTAALTMFLSQESLGVSGMSQHFLETLFSVGDNLHE
jgi:hypothetical protein